MTGDLGTTVGWSLSLGALLLMLGWVIPADRLTTCRLSTAAMTLALAISGFLPKVNQQLGFSEPAWVWVSLAVFAVAVGTSARRPILAKRTS